MPDRPDSVSILGPIGGRCRDWPVLPPEARGGASHQIPEIRMSLEYMKASMLQFFVGYEATLKESIDAAIDHAIETLDFPAVIQSHVDRILRDVIENRVKSLVNGVGYGEQGKALDVVVRRAVRVALLRTISEEDGSVPCSTCGHVLHY